MNMLTNRTQQVQAEVQWILKRKIGLIKMTGLIMIDAMTFTPHMDIHNGIMQEGFDRRDDEYYNEINTRTYTKRVSS